jgi:hypothetical protein
VTLDSALLARVQFPFTVSFHIIFPTSSIGLAMFLAIMDGPCLFRFPLPSVSRQDTGRRVGWMRAGHRWTWFVGLYAASVAALAFATLLLKRILAYLN